MVHLPVEENNSFTHKIIHPMPNPILTQQTAYDIRTLFSMNDETTILAICKLHSMEYMTEVYRHLTQTEKDRLLKLVSDHN